MVAADQLPADGFSATVGQEHTGVIPKHRIANGRLHANASGAAGDNQVLDAELFEPVIKVGIKEATEAVFVELELPLLRRELRQDFGTPVIPNQYSRLGSIRREHLLTDLEEHVPVVVGGAGWAGIRKVRLEPHPEINDAQTMLPGGGKYSSDGRHHGPYRRDVDARTIEHAPLGTKIVLHVHNQEGSGVGFK